MANVKLKLNIAGLRELRNSKEMCAILSEEAGKIVQRAGDGFEAEEPYHGTGRANVRVKPSNAKAYYHNLKHNTLLKAIGK